VWVDPYAPTKKHCSRCREYLPFEAFRPNPRNKRFGLDAWCRGCRAEYLREHRAANPEKYAAYNVARRVLPRRLECSECGGEFYGRKDRRTCSDGCRRARKARMDIRWPKDGRARSGI
jgi:hypothetical protein